MSCSRCNGCMVEDFLLDMEDSSGPMWLQAWRCMNCGNFSESVFERNRQTQGAKPTSHVHSVQTDVQFTNTESLSDLAA
jgi:hypothetical protein